VSVAVFALTPGSFLDAAPPSGGTLTVITVPERAEVWINDGYTGLTPIRDKSLAAGKYTLRLVDPSRQKSTSETIVISDDERLLVERALGGSSARLRVDTDPQGADVSISTDLGKTPLINDYLTTGEYRIEIRHPNAKYQTFTKDVSFIDGQPVTISLKLEKPPIFTFKRCVQLGLGTGAILAWTGAVIEQHQTSSLKQKSKDMREGAPDESKKLQEQSNEAGIWRTIAIVAGASLAVALQVTIFIW
jgi:hypothetical protein